MALWSLGKLLAAGAAGAVVFLLIEKGTCGSNCRKGANAASGIWFRWPGGRVVRLGTARAVAPVLALLCTECPRRTVDYVATASRALPQGACMSFSLSKLLAR